MMQMLPIKPIDLQNNALGLRFNTKFLKIHLALTRFWI